MLVRFVSLALTCFLALPAGAQGPGVLRLSDGSPAFVEVASPTGIDPCGPSAISTGGCQEVGGNGLVNSLNSDGTYLMGVSGSAGSEATVGSYAPNDFQIRFTDTGSFAVYPFTSPGEEVTLIPVPFEVWDVGSEPPFTVPDPSDDIQLIPVLFADGGGNCAFDFGETELSGRPATDRIYAYYPFHNDYTSYHTAAAALVASDPDLCVEGAAATDLSDAFVDYGRGRPIQRQVIADNTGTADVSVLQGTVIMFYTAARPPVASESGPDEEATLRAYPNPVRGALTVPYRLVQPGEARVSVYDALGREVAVLSQGAHAAGLHEAALDTSSLAAGVYTVVLEAGETRATRRVVVVR